MKEDGDAGPPSRIVAGPAASTPGMAPPPTATATSATSMTAGVEAITEEGKHAAMEEDGDAAASPSRIVAGPTASTPGTPAPPPTATATSATSTTAGVEVIMEEGKHAAMEEDGGAMSPSAIAVVPPSTIAGTAPPPTTTPTSATIKTAGVEAITEEEGKHAAMEENSDAASPSAIAVVPPSTIAGTAPPRTTTATSTPAPSAFAKIFPTPVADEDEEAPHQLRFGQLNPLHGGQSAAAMTGNTPPDAPTSKRTCKSSTSGSIICTSRGWLPRYYWCACIALTAAMMCNICFAKRLSFSQSSLWIAFGCSPICFPWTFSVFSLYRVAFPGYKMDRVVWWSVAIVMCFLDFVATSGHPPYPVMLGSSPTPDDNAMVDQGTIGAIVYPIAHFLFWTLFLVGHFWLPAWLTREFWWTGRSRGIFVMACTFVTSTWGNSALPPDLGGLVCLLVQCATLAALFFWIFFLDHRFGANDSETPDGGCLILLSSVTTTSLPWMYSSILRTIGEHMLDDLGHPLVLLLCWQLFNALWYLAVIRLAQRAIGPRFVALSLFGLMVTGDVMINLVFLDTSLEDPFFWAALCLELCSKVVRDSGLLLDLSEFWDTHGCRCLSRVVQQADTAIDLTTGGTKAHEAALHRRLHEASSQKSIRGEEQKNGTVRDSVLDLSRRPSMRVLTKSMRDVLRARADAARANVKMRVPADVRDQIAELSALSEVRCKLLRQLRTAFVPNTNACVRRWLQARASSWYFVSIFCYKLGNRRCCVA